MRWWITEWNWTQIVEDMQNSYHNFVKQGKSEGFDSCDRPSNPTQIGFKSSIFQPVTLKFDGWPRKTIGHLFYATLSFLRHFVAIGELKLELQSGNA